MMTDLIVGIVSDVLRHIPIEHLESRDVRRREPGGDFLAVKFQINRGETLVGGSAKFHILNPQVGLDLLQSAQERQNGDVALGDWRVVVVLLLSAEGRRGRRQKRRAHGCGPRCHYSVLQE